MGLPRRLPSRTGSAKGVSKRRPTRTSDPSRKPERAPKRARPEPEEPEDEARQEEEEQESRTTRPTSKLRRKSGGRPRAATRAPSGEKSFLAGLGLKIVGAVAVVAIVVLVNLFSGSAAYDTAFQKLQPGMSRAQVVTLMGKPDVAQPMELLDGPAGELLGFEAIDRTGRRSSKHTFYFVILEGGKVVDKQRMTEAEFKAKFGR